MLDDLGPGEIGFFTAAIKQWPTPASATPSPTKSAPAAQALPGFKPVQPVVFCGLFPVDAADFEDLREAMGKLRLNDASFEYEMETCAALGFGFRCGFLGLLHLEIIHERLEREFNLDLITTAPCVIYHIYMTDGAMIELHNPADMPDVVKIDRIEEPWIKATIMVPDEYLGAVLKLCEDRRGRQMELTYAGNRAMVVYRTAAERSGLRFLRPAEIRSAAAMPASTTTSIGYEEGDLVKMSDPGQRRAGRCAVHDRAPRRAESRGRTMCERLKELIPRHLFKIPIQAAIGGQGDRARNAIGAAQGRDRQMLRRRHHPQAQAARQAEGRQEEDAPVRQGRDPARGLHRRAEDGCELTGGEGEERGEGKREGYEEGKEEEKRGGGGGGGEGGREGGGGERGGRGGGVGEVGEGRGGSRGRGGKKVRKSRCRSRASPSTKMDWPGATVRFASKAAHSSARRPARSMRSRALASAVPASRRLAKQDFVHERRRVQRCCARFPPDAAWGRRLPASLPPS